jgi:V8-like Glu-specific endopeptidase
MAQRHTRRRSRGPWLRAASAAGLLCAVLAGCGGTSHVVVSGSAASPVAVGVSGSPGNWSKDRLERALSEHGGTSRQARATPSNARVGALFHQDADGGHFCTASVVHSPHKNVLLTAAHCVHGGQGGSYASDLVFIPDYRDGTTPQGQWPVTSIVVDQRWIASSDPDLDVAFVTVGQVGGKNIEDVLGANTLGVDKGFTNVVQITGYPSTASAPISCFNRTEQQSQYQTKIACTGFPGGTSGSPWLTSFDPTTRTGTVIGVIGGYEQGGDSPDVSYSPYFDADVQSLYNQAVDQDD